MQILSALPPRSFIMSQLLRGAVLWLLVRLIVISIVSFGGGASGMVDSETASTVSPVASLILIAAVAALAFVDARIMREQLFFSNLGISPRYTPLLAAGAALSLELLVRVLS